MQHWPTQIWILRHRESAGNVARDAAHSGGLAHIAVPERDVDVPLSALGESQSVAVGQWFARKPIAERPELTFSPAMCVRTMIVPAFCAGSILSRRRATKRMGIVEPID